MRVLQRATASPDAPHSAQLRSCSAGCLLNLLMGQDHLYPKVCVWMYVLLLSYYSIKYWTILSYWVIWVFFSISRESFFPMNDGFLIRLYSVWRWNGMTKMLGRLILCLWALENVANPLIKTTQPTNNAINLRILVSRNPPIESLTGLSLSKLPSLN